MNCLYITLFFNTVAGIVQTFIKSWNQLLYPRVIELCRLHFEPRHDFFLHYSDCCLDSGVLWKKPMFHLQSQWSPETHLPPVRSGLRWEILWRNAPRIWRDFGSALPFQTRLTQTKPVVPLSNEHGSQVKNQGRRQCCCNKHKKFPYRPTCDVFLLSGHASYIHIWT